MTRLKVSEEVGDSISYIISNFNASDIPFLYDNYRYLASKHDLKALKILKKEQLLECFLGGYEVLKALSTNDLKDNFVVKEHSTNMLLEVRKVGEYYLAYLLFGDKPNHNYPYPLTVEQVLNLINISQWEIVSQGKKK